MANITIIFIDGALVWLEDEDVYADMPALIPAHIWLLEAAH